VRKITETSRPVLLFALFSFFDPALFPANLSIACRQIVASDHEMSSRKEQVGYGGK